MSSSFKYVFKYIIIGNPAVGKSCLLNQFLNGKFLEEYEITVGVEFGAKTIEVGGGERIKLQIWDTAGQESFKSITRAYYRAAAVAVLVYDISSQESFDAIENWLNECKTNGNSEMTLILVGNKSDLSLSRVISTEEANNFAQANNMLFVETSAKDNSNIDTVFVQSAERVLYKIDTGVLDAKNENNGIKLGTSYVLNESIKYSAVTEKKKSCCK